MDRTVENLEIILKEIYDMIVGKKRKRVLKRILKKLNRLNLVTPNPEGSRLLLLDPTWKLRCFSHVSLALRIASLFDLMSSRGRFVTHRMGRKSKVI